MSHSKRGISFECHKLSNLQHLQSEQQFRKIRVARYFYFANEQKVEKDSFYKHIDLDDAHSLHYSIKHAVLLHHRGTLLVFVSVFFFWFAQFLHVAVLRFACCCCFVCSFPSFCVLGQVVLFCFSTF